MRAVAGCELVGVYAAFRAVPKHEVDGSQHRLTVVIPMITNCASDCGLDRWEAF